MHWVSLSLPLRVLVWWLWGGDNKIRVSLNGMTVFVYASSPDLLKIKTYINFTQRLAHQTLWKPEHCCCCFYSFSFNNSVNKPWLVKWAYRSRKQFYFEGFPGSTLPPRLARTATGHISQETRAAASETEKNNVDFERRHDEQRRWDVSRALRVLMKVLSE